uniref:Uncharacterized protein n=1 Tax=Physcomitrium patens TaxID=3218 RepID=A0A2K1JPL0_PHYPA|nr:hypothetical protein PHYPA_015860 [Physcomitrium patens]
MKQAYKQMGCLRKISGTIVIAKSSMRHMQSIVPNQ